LNKSSKATSWGAVEVGRWNQQQDTVVGRCARCRRVTAARGLHLVTLGFGRGEEWRCDNCRLTPKDTTSDDKLAFRIAYLKALEALAAQAK
jgi:hypothetical protein